MIVGTSVEPYVRFTRAPNARRRLGRRTPAPTPAPPLEIRRRLATRCGAKPGACIIETKNVGGPTMNVTRSRSMSVSAASGSQRAMKTVRNGTTPGNVMPFSKPEMCAAGAGISTQSSGPRSCACCICAALYASVACVCSTPLGVPLDPDVNSTAASRLASAHGFVDRIAGRERVEIVDDERGSHRGEHARDVGRRPSGGARARRSRRAASTRGTAPRPRRGWPTATRPRRPGSTPSARSPPATRATCSASAGVGDAREQRVERRQVPRTARAAVVGRRAAM